MKIVFAVATAAVSSGGLVHSIREGDHFPANDPVVLANPGMFSEDPRTGLRYTEPPVEQATAGPGEVRRNVRR